MLLVPMLAAVTLSLSDATDLSLRSRPETRTTALDLNTYPSVVLASASKRSTWDLGYRPRIGWIDLTANPELIVQHSAGAGYAWSTRRLRLSLAVSGSYGKVGYYAAVAQAAPAAPAGGDANPGPADPNAGGGATPGPGDPGTVPTPGQGQPVVGAPMQGPQYLPQVSVLETASAGVSLGMGYTISHRWSLSLGIGYSAGGGLGSSEPYLPFRHGPNAAIGVGYQITKADGLNSSLGANLDVVPKRKSRFYTINLLETWTHQFNSLMTGSLGVGATYVQSRVGQLDPLTMELTPGPRTRSVNGAGVVGLTRAFKLDGGALLTVGGGGTLSTTYNPVVGTFYQSVSGGAGVGWSRKRLALQAGAQASHSLPLDDPQALKSYGGNAGATYQLAAPVALYAGGYWTHQVLPATALNTIDPNRWGANIGISLAAPPIKF